MTLGHHVIVSYLSAAQAAPKTVPGTAASGNRVGGGGGVSGGMAGHSDDAHSMDAKMTPRTLMAKQSTSKAAAPKPVGGSRPFSSITAESVHSESRPMFLYFLVIAVILATLASHSAIVGVEAAGRRSYHCSEYLYLNMRPTSQQQSPYNVLAYSYPPNNPRVYDILRGRAIMLRRQGMVTHDRGLNQPNSWIRYGFQTRPTISRNKMLNSTDLIVEARVGWLSGRRPLDSECQASQYKVTFFINDQELISHDLTNNPRKPRPSNVRIVVPQSAWEPAARGLRRAAEAAAGRVAGGNSTSTTPAGGDLPDESLRLTMQMMQRNEYPSSPCLDRTSLYMKHLKLCRAAH